jgi:hypothetical protein
MFAKSTNSIYPVAEVVTGWLLEKMLSGYQLPSPFDSFGYSNLPREGMGGGLLSGGPPSKD